MRKRGRMRRRMRRRMTVKKKGNTTFAVASPVPSIYKLSTHST
jgi:hypothetical protein